VKVLILKAKTLLGKDQKDEAHKTACKMISSGVLILDECWDYEVVDIDKVVVEEGA